MRIFSGSAGLDTSTTTPKSTVSEGSLTIPVIEACACATAGEQNDGECDCSVCESGHARTSLARYFRFGDPGSVASYPTRPRSGQNSSARPGSVRYGFQFEGERQASRHALPTLNLSKPPVEMVPTREDVAHRFTVQQQFAGDHTRHLG